MRTLLSRALALLLCLSLPSAMALAGDVFTDPNVNPPGVLPVAKERATLSIAAAQVSTVLDYDTNYLVNWLEERDNVDIVWELFPATDAEAKFDLMVASGSKLADVTTIGLNPTTVLKYGSNGVIIPLNHYYENGAAAFLEKRMEEVGQPNFLNYLTSADGNIYVLGRNNSSFGNIASVRAHLNMDWLAKLGLEEPTTIDAFVDMLVAFRDQDPNGNGQKDEIPMIGSVGGWNTDVFPFLQNLFIYYDARGNYHLVEDGVLDVSYDKDDYREALRFAKKLVDEKLLSELSFTQDYSSYTAMASGETQIIGLGVSGSVSGFAANQNSYHTMETVAGPNGQKYTSLVPQVPAPVAAITSSCKSPDLAFRVMESTYGDLVFETMQYLGEPGVDWVDLTDEERAEYDIGIPGNLFVLRLNEVHGQMQNKNLGQTVFPTLTTSAGIPQFVRAGEDGKVDVDLLARSREGNRRLVSIKENFPEEYLETIIYTTEESEQWSELRSVILSYVKECQARFIVGDMDIERDWDAYLAELNMMGYKDMLAADQVAYDRTIGK